MSNIFLQAGAWTARFTDGDAYHYAIFPPPMMTALVIVKSDVFFRENIEKLDQSGKINGVLVPYSPNDTDIPSSFSADQSCPNQQHSKCSAPVCSVIGVTVLEITVLPVPVNVYQVKDLVDYGI